MSSCDKNMIRSIHIITQSMPTRYSLANKHGLKNIICVRIHICATRSYTPTRTPSYHQNREYRSISSTIKTMCVCNNHCMLVYAITRGTHYRPLYRSDLSSWCTWVFDTVNRHDRGAYTHCRTKLHRMCRWWAWKLPLYRKLILVLSCCSCNGVRRKHPLYAQRHYTGQWAATYVCMTCTTMADAAIIKCV